MSSSERIRNEGESLARDAKRVLDECWTRIHGAKSRQNAEASRYVCGVLMDLCETSVFARSVGLAKMYRKLRQEASSWHADPALGATGIPVDAQHVARQFIGDSHWYQSALCRLEGKLTYIRRSCTDQWLWRSESRSDALQKKWRVWIPPFSIQGSGEECLIQGRMLNGLLVAGSRFAELVTTTQSVEDLNGKLKAALTREVEEAMPEIVKRRFVGMHARNRGFNVETVVEAALAYHGEVFSSHHSAVWDMLFFPRNLDGRRIAIAVQVKAGEAVFSGQAFQEMLEFEGVRVVLVLRIDKTEGRSLVFDLWKDDDLRSMGRTRRTGQIALPRRRQARGELRIELEPEVGAIIKHPQEILNSLCEPEKEVQQ